MPISVRFELYDGGGLVGEDLYFHGPAGPFAWVEKTSGGVLTRSIANLGDLQDSSMNNPNVLPGEKVAGQLGLTTTLDGETYTNATHFTRGVEADLVTSISSPLSVPGDVNYITCRYFMKKFQLRVKWSDGTLLKGRAVRIASGQSPVYDFHPVSGSPTPPFTEAEVSSALYATSLPTSIPLGEGINYQRTDDDGIATYYLMIGIAVGISNDNATFYWGFDQPPVTDLGDGNFLTQNFAMGVAYQEQLETLEDDHIYQQWASLDPLTEKTSGWSVDYTLYSDGLLSYSNPPIAEHVYHQSGTVRPYDATGFIPATITFGPFSGTSGVPIPAVPKGSLLDRYRMSGGDLLGDPIYATDLPVLDASGYPASVSSDAAPHLQKPYADTPWLAAIYSGKTSDKLTGLHYKNVQGYNSITRAYDLGLEEFPYNYEFAGGEVVTQSYEGTWTATDGSGKSGTFLLWIHEDRDLSIDVWFSVPVVSGGFGGMDYAVDPEGNHWLTEARAGPVVQITSRDMEATFETLQILDEAITSPSRQVRADHLHLLAGIKAGAFDQSFSKDFDVGGVTKLWTSKDTDAWVLAARIDDSRYYTGVTIRFDPSGILHAFLIHPATDTSAVLYRATSTDGGETWEASEAASGLPDLRPEPVDVRFEGDRWLSAAGAQAGSVEIYSSPDALAWTHETTVAPGRMPVLLPLEGRSYLAIYRTPGAFDDAFNNDFDVALWKSRRLFDYEMAWTVEDPVTIQRGKGMAAFRNPQKVLAASHGSGDDAILYSKSQSEGDAYVLGSEG